MSYLGATQPVFLDKDGNAVTSLGCGEAYSFTVQGIGAERENIQVWLDQTLNGKLQYSGPFTVPMAPYISDCSAQVGTYVNAVYSMATGVKGNFLGYATFTIKPGTLGVGVKPTEGAGGAAGGSGNLLAYGALGLAALLFLRRR